MASFNLSVNDQQITVSACLVHVDDEPTVSCTLPVSAVTGRRITTIEGLAKAKLHPVQQVWIDVDVPQCGYCQTGMVVMAASAYDRKLDYAQNGLYSTFS